MMQIVLDIGYLFATYAVLSCSFVWIYRTNRFFDFTQAAVITLGAYVTFFFVAVGNLTLLSAGVASMLSNISLVLFLNHVAYNRLKVLEVEGWRILVASIGIYIVLQNLVSVIWGDNVRVLRTWPIKEGNEFLGAYISDVRLTTIFLATSLVSLTWFFFERTRIGRKIRAVSEDNELSQVFGISPNRAVVWSFAIGSALAACAGILIALDTDMTPTMGFNWLLYGVVAMIIGGLGKIHHLMLGALLLASAQHLAAYYLDSKWMNATSFILLILFLAWRPYGFSGRRLKKAEI